MSTHCNRYPECGCNSSIGTKCHLKEGDRRLKEREREIKQRDLLFFAKNFMKPITPDDHIGAKTEPKRKPGSNYTKPKKRKK